MQIQFNAFGHKVQVSKFNCFKVEIYSDRMHEENEASFERYFAYFWLAVLRGWLVSRQFAKMDGVAYHFVISEMQMGYWVPKKLGTISGKYKIPFLPKFYSIK